MQAGEIVYLRCYGDPGVIHTRLLVGQVQGDEWMIITPDRDIYVEELARRNPDVQHMWHAPDGRLARGAPASQVYGFRPMNAAEFAALMRSGRVELEAECIQESGRRVFNGRGVACDGRILARHFNALGQPERPLAEVVAASKELGMGWKMSWPSDGPLVFELLSGGRLRIRGPSGGFRNTFRPACFFGSWCKSTRSTRATVMGSS